jgi:UDPglucose 6-dehydrogenase
MVKIGIIGYGIVGKAMEHTFKGKVSSFYISDPKLNGSLTIKEVFQNSDYIFVCVPTPMSLKTREMDSRIIDSVMEELYATKKTSQNDPIIIIKSTVIPSKLKEYSERFKELRLTMSPEYLTEKNYLEDALKLKSLVVGGDSENDCLQVIKLYEKWSNCESGYKAGYVDLIGAGVLKYMENCFLALKVSFMNEMYKIHEASGSESSWDKMGDTFHLDSRMGNSHYRVPGHDGDFGWGGKCFPKDVNAMIKYAEGLGLVPNTVVAAWKTNTEVRNDKDWLRIEGAVS